MGLLGAPGLKSEVSSERSGSWHSCGMQASRDALNHDIKMYWRVSHYECLLCCAYRARRALCVVDSNCWEFFSANSCLGIFCERQVFIVLDTMRKLMIYLKEAWYLFSVKEAGSWPLFWVLQPLERLVPTETLFWALHPLGRLVSA